MAEKRLIDANALLEHIEGTEWYTINYKGEASHGSPCEEVAWYKATDIYSAIDNAPTVDAVEVIRCRECEYWNTEEKSYFGTKCRCERFSLVGYSENYMLPNDFCSYGERRTDG